MSKISNFALIIGAMKAGTTSLFNYLAEHPEIAASKIKEPNFFTDAEKWSRGLSWYESLWNWKPEIHRVAMEASTAYTKLPSFSNAAQRIAHMSTNGHPRFKFIYIMRDPIERIESHHAHAQTDGWLSNKASLKHGMVHKHLIEVSKYAKQIDEYYKRFPEQDIKLLVLEELKSNPLNNLKDICRFLGVDPGYEFKRLGVIHNAIHHRITNSALVRLKQTNAAHKFSAVLPRPLKETIKVALGRKQKDSIRLSSSQREQVLAALRPDLHRLQSVYDVDISRWGIDI